MNRSLLALSLLLAGCATTEDTDTDVVDTAREQEMAACLATELPEDFNPDAGLDDPSSWGPFPDTAVVSTTYLRLNPEGMETFGQVMGPIMGDLMSREGLLGVSLADSMSCGTARTLTVWASEEAMMGFVTGEAHLAAIAEVATISRGGSITDSWSRAALGEDLSWATVVQRLADHSGPEY